MKDWIERLDDFIKMTGNDILQSNRGISYQEAIKKASEEYGKYKKQTKNELSEGEKDFVKQFEASIKKLKAKQPEK